MIQAKRKINFIEYKIAMFKKKQFPPGTFIPTAARLFCILQLTLAFTLLAWKASIPFMEELFETKSKMLLYQHLMGKKEVSHADRFAQLPERDQILAEYNRLQQRLEIPFLTKLERSIVTLWQIPLLEKVWILLAILIPILLLKKVEGAAALVWILPFITLAYALDNRLMGVPRGLTAEQQLFPSEQQILKEPLKSTLAQQKEQLEKAWESYLVLNWANETPEKEAAAYRAQVNKGDFAFTLARIKAVQQKEPRDTSQESLLLLSLYLFWNLSFALVVYRYVRAK